MDGPEGGKTGGGWILSIPFAICTRVEAAVKVDGELGKVDHVTWKCCRVIWSDSAGMGARMNSKMGWR